MTNPTTIPALRRFNPRPALLPGESAGGDYPDMPFDDVSIHARHCCRANQ